MEDRIGWGENYLFAIDGASMLTPAHVTAADSDAAWLSEGLRRGLEELLPTDMGLADILSCIACRLRAEYDGLWQSRGETSAPDYPSAGVGVLRVRGDVLEYIGLGDITVCVETETGVDIIREEHLTALDRGVLDKMEALRRETGCTIQQARREFDDLLLYNRGLRNHPGGYWIFDPSGDGVSHARLKTWPRGSVTAAAVMSDGFAQLCDTFHVAADARELYGLMKTRGLAALSRELFSLQQNDPQFEKYPRFKIMDDTTAAWARLE